jgi:hypothetical protein
MYQPFQQGAVVAESQTTLVDLRVKPSRLVNVTFIVSVPGDTVPGVPVRIAGNILQLGNTFADLLGAVETKKCGYATASTQTPSLLLLPGQ